MPFWDLVWQESTKSCGKSCPVGGPYSHRQILYHIKAHPPLAVVGNGDLPQAETVLAERFQLGARVPAAFAAKTVARFLLHLPGVDVGS